MKNLSRFLLFASLLFIISSCTEKSVVEEMNQSESLESIPPAYVISYDNEEVSITEFSLSNLDTETKVLAQKSYKNNINHAAHGIVTTTSPNTLVFNAVKNKSGVHGVNYIDGSYFVNVKFKSECLTTLNNQAFFGGSITSWEAGPEFPPGTQVEEGWLLFAPVEDNGEGANTTDAFGAQLMLFPPGTTIKDIESFNGLPSGYYALHNIHSICDYVASLYAVGNIPYIFIPGENPTNVQVK